MNSLENRFSRYIAGGISEVANGKIEWWERSTSFTSDDTDSEYAVENRYEGRLDKIASDFFGNPRYWWIIAQINNILDPIKEITPGRIIKIPSLQRVQTLMTSNIGGIESSRIETKIISPIIL